MNEFSKPVSSHARAFGLFSAALLAACGLSIGEAQAASATANAGATVIQPIAISKVNDLQFGTFSAATSGTVILDTNDGRTTTGGVLLSSSTLGQAASFNVTGEGTATYAITLPANGDVSLTGPGTPMGVTNWLSVPSGTGALTSGAQTVKVAATLNVGDTQAAGAYTSTFNVTVEYN